MDLLTAKAYQTDFANDWCAGCGDFGILNALHKALAGLGLAPEAVALFGGIGCSGKTPYYVGCYGVHTLHGRVLPTATGAKLANPDLTVVAVGGDGDGLGIGVGHFVNAGRRNVDLTYLLYNNEVYGLTKGQAAPTLGLGLQPKSLPAPNLQGAVNGPLLAFASGFTWIGRGYAYGVKQLVELIQRAVRHPGLAYLEVLQPCPTYNDLHTREWFAGKDRPDGTPRVFDLATSGYDARLPAGADAAARAEAAVRFLRIVQTADAPLPLGVFWEDTQASTFEARIAQALPGYRRHPPARRRIAGADGAPRIALETLLAELSV
jgi:2-oxoglutarate ferredoxin oxidoreductase subunit beta